MKQVAWSVDKLLGTFLEDIYSKGEGDAEPDELGSVKIFKDKEEAVEHICDDDIVCHEPASPEVPAGRSDGNGEPVPMV